MKYLLIPLFILSFGLNANSQAAIFALLFGDKVATENFNVSMEAGIASSAISNMEYDPNRGLAAQFGIGFNIKVSEVLTISPQTYFFSVRSIRLNDAPVYQGENIEILEDFSDVTLRLRYIDIPVEFNYTFRNSNWAVGVAPQVSFLMASNIQYEFSNNESLRAEIDDFGESLDFGFQTFVNRTFELGGQKLLVLGIRYYQGLKDVIDQDTGFTEGSNRANYLGLSASFPFIAKPEN